MLYALLFPLILGGFIFSVQMNLLEGGRFPIIWWVFLLTVAGGIVSIVCFWFYIKGLREEPSDVPPPKKRARRFVLAILMTTVSAMLTYIAVDRGEYCLYYTSQQDLRRVHELLLKQHLNQLDELQNSGASPRDIAEVTSRINHNTANVFNDRTGLARVLTSALAASFVILLTVFAWYNAIWPKT